MSKNFRVSGFKLPLNQAVSRGALAHALGIEAEQLVDYQIVKQSLDARKHPQEQGLPLYYAYTLDVTVDSSARLRPKRGLIIADVPPPPRLDIRIEAKALPHRPVIIGAGPAGLFAALLLAQNGYRPLIVERGKDLASRRLDVERFWREGKLDLNSNVQFGAGGAGAFSDGKLTSRSKDPLGALVLQQLTSAGAPQDITYIHKPHIGSDGLFSVTQNLIDKILALGGDISYGSRLDDIIIDNDALKALRLSDLSDDLAAEACILAIGHSARDTYTMLASRGLLFAPKSFAVGFRVEHPQYLIDRSQYGDMDASALGAADYQLRYQEVVSGRGVYSFCMCPGGQIVNAASEADALVTNGMSNSRRDSGRANSAVVVTVNPSDFGDEPLAGIAWQRRLEKAAFAAAGGGYALPAESVADYLKGGAPGALPKDFQPLSAGATPADLRQLLPDEIACAIAKALSKWDEVICGFAGSQAVLAAVETRTSTPVRILRDAERQAIGIRGLFPAGEGAGYAGGIVSSAIDGLRSALALMERYGPPQ